MQVRGESQSINQLIRFNPSLVRSSAYTITIPMHSSTSKRRKKVSVDINVKQDEEDRFSNLPSCLISRIVSLLPAKDAVATSILSTKWKDFWKLTTILEFDNKLPPILSKERSHLLQQSFTNFVYRVLLHCPLSSLRKFDLKCSKGFDVSHINAWVSSVLEHNVPQLHLCVHIESSSQLPRKLFTCNTLVELKLAGRSVMNPPESALLPSLKVLDIDGFQFLDDGSITRLLSGCPLLGELRMSDCIGKDVQVFKISSPLLTNLVLYGMPHWDLFHPNVNTHKLKIVLETPALSDLAYDDRIPEGFAFKNVHHLKNAHISIWSTAAADDDEQLFCCNDAHCKPVHDIFEGISGVHFLKLGGRSLQVFDDATLMSLRVCSELFHTYVDRTSLNICLNELSLKAIQGCQNLVPTFKHMMELELERDSAAQLKGLPMLLSKSPHLRALTFGFTWRYCGSGRPLGFHPVENVVPNCLLYHLRIVKISMFYGLDEDLKIVEYFLDNARVLEKLVIRCSMRSSKTEISSKLLMMPRTSRCRIELL